MSKKDEALKLALEALEAHADIGIKADKAITAIREALAEQPAQQQEPATVVGAIPMGHNQKDMPFAHVDHLPIGTKLYTSPQPSKPLTNEQIGQAARDAQIAFCLNKHQTYEHALTRAIEAAHGIKEKNNG